MHILHLLDPALCGDEGMLACHNLTVDPHPETHHEFYLLGSAADERRAWSLGIPTTDRIHPRTLGSNAPALRRLIRSHNVRPDVVQCWSLNAFELAREVFDPYPGGPARVAVICNPPRDAHTSQLDRPAAGETICALDLHTRATLAHMMSIPPDENRWAPAIHLLEPPAFTVTLANRQSIRDSLDLDPTDIAIAPLADLPSTLDAMSAIFTAGVLHALGHRAVFLIRRGAQQERRAANYLRNHAQRWGMILCDLSLPDFLAAADIALVERAHSSAQHPTPTCGPIAVSLALSMGIPVASTRHTFTSGHSAPGEPWPVLVSNAKGLGRTAVPLADLLANPALRTDLLKAAGAWCHRARVRNSFRQALNNIWQELPIGPHSSHFHEPLAVE
jgi:hypothetical protein